MAAWMVSVVKSARPPLRAPLTAVRVVEQDRPVAAVPAAPAGDGGTSRQRQPELHARDIKFREYAAAGIPEYWIVDEDATSLTDATVEIYHLRAGDYELILEVRLSELVDGSVKVPTR